MNNTVKYMLSLSSEVEMLLGHVYDTKQEAINAAVGEIKAFNRAIALGKVFVPDTDVFGNDIDSILAIEHTIQPIDFFYLHTMSTPEIPKTLGGDVIRLIDERYWAEQTYIFNEYTLNKHLNENDILELNQLIYNFLDEKTKSYNYYTAIKVEQIFE